MWKRRNASQSVTACYIHPDARPFTATSPDRPILTHGFNPCTARHRRTAAHGRSPWIATPIEHGRARSRARACSAQPTQRWLILRRGKQRPYDQHADRHADAQNHNVHMWLLQRDVNTVAQFVRESDPEDVKAPVN